ncbi:MAG: hypothetical protein OEW36_06555 [Hylemonella sp.]|nr:hypothetical protein [Hylemonella sp.]
MLKSLMSLVLLVAVLGLAAVTNPSPARHRAMIESTLSERSLLSKALNLGALAAFASNYHSLGVASYTKVNEKVATVGAFGLIYVVE